MLDICVHFCRVAKFVVKFLLNCLRLILFPNFSIYKDKIKFARKLTKKKKKKYFKRYPNGGVDLSFVKGSINEPVVGIIKSESSQYHKSRSNRAAWLTSPIN